MSQKAQTIKLGAVPSVYEAAFSCPALIAFRDCLENFSFYQLWPSLRPDVSLVCVGLQPKERELPLESSFARVQLGL